MTLPVLPVYKALAALLADVTGKPVGMAKLVRVLDDTGKPTEPADLPQTVLYVDPGGVSGPWSDATADARQVYRAKAVARRADQVEWLMDRIREAVLGRTGGDWTHPLVVDGISVMTRELDSESPIDPEQEKVFSRSLVFCLYLTPDGT